MNKVTRILITFSILLTVSATQAQEQSIEKWKKEIVETEKAFAEMVAEKGITTGFLFYAAEDAVLKRNDDTLFIGKTSIKDYLTSQPEMKINLTWEPDFVDVAQSGDLGYTYGYYLLSLEDPNGKTIEKKGVFHTVWKRQADGSWRFVWD